MLLSRKCIRHTFVENTDGAHKKYERDRQTDGDRQTDRHRGTEKRPAEKKKGEKKERKTT